MPNALAHQSLLALAGFAATLAVAGTFAGFVAGLLGVGGGIVLVPVLFHLLGILGVDETVRMHVAVGTSLATIIPTSLSSIRAHRARDAIDTRLLRAWGPWIAFGVVAGITLAAIIHGKALTAVFAIMALLVAVYMALTPEDARVASRLPTGPLKAVVASAVGAISTLMGIGGGTLMVPTLSLCGYPIRRAVGTASAVGLIVAVPGALGFALIGWNTPELPPASLGYVNLLGILTTVPASILTAPLGAALAHAMNVRGLRRVFALFLALTAARMFGT